MPDWIDVQAAAVVLMAIVGAILTIDKLLDIAKRRVNDPKLADISWRHDTDARLARGDAHMQRQDKAIDLVLESQMQILQHLAYGNHTNELKGTIRELQKYLIDEREQ